MFGYQKKNNNNNNNSIPAQPTLSNWAPSNSAQIDQTSVIV